MIDSAATSVVTDPDADCVVAAARGDQRAFARLVDRHLERLHALAFRVLGGRAEAEDVVQDTLLRAWRQLPQWQPGAARFSTWMQRVALNLCNDRLRARRDLVQVSELELASASPGPEQHASQQQRAEQVRRALQELPERQRDALILCHFQGLGNIQAAAALELSVDALESLLGRARRELRERLSEPV